MRADAPVRNQPLVTGRFRSDIIARTVRHPFEDAQHRIRITDIND